MDPELLVSRQGQAGIILLNRPKALNTLTLGMVRGMDAQLRAWMADDAVALVIVKGAGDRAFCAGGDIRKLHDGGKSGDDYPFLFWHDEYRLNALIKHYPKPYVALLDGITMGGGVGVSVHGRFRVASERALFAMPETGIGLFPDVGGSFFLPRLPGELGLYLALTGRRLGSSDMLYAGIATQCVPSAAFGGLEEALCRPAAEAATTISTFAGVAGEPEMARLQPAIDRLFAGDSLPAIFDRLRRDDSDFARETLATLAGRSPSSMALTFRQLREGAKRGFDDCMRLDWRIASHVPALQPDFFEGVRAVIIEKDNAPRWTPASLADVDPAVIDRFFEPSPRGELAIG